MCPGPSVAPHDVADALGERDGPPGIAKYDKDGVVSGNRAYHVRKQGPVMAMAVGFACAGGVLSTTNCCTRSTWVTESAIARVIAPGAPDGVTTAPVAR